MVRQALTALSAVGYSGLTEADLAKLRGADTYEQELIVMAETSAYFHIAYKVRDYCSQHDPRAR